MPVALDAVFADARTPHNHLIGRDARQVDGDIHACDLASQDELEEVYTRDRQ
ncbi:MAG: hypothetical protein ACJAVZ_002042 [Afipia broomeae]|jgi:hypothetical protein